MSVGVERFRILKRIGTKVWKCEDFSRDGEIVVVKCVNGENELSILGEVRGTQFATLYDVFKHRKSTYAVMEYVESDLLDYLTENPIVDEEEARRIFAGILDAVTTLYRLTGYYHADLKAENVLIDDRKNVKLIDFGVMVKQGENISSLNGGTKAYFPPEKVNGTTESFVVWTLGLILYRLLVGSDLPYDKETGSVRRDIASKTNYEGSKGAFDLLRRCLRLDYRKRASLKDVQRHYWITGNRDWLCFC